MAIAMWEHLASGGNCPTCRRPFEAQKVTRRVCAECGQPISNHHKWRIWPDGRLRHRHCDDPTAYLTAAQRRTLTAREQRRVVGW